MLSSLVKSNVLFSTNLTDVEGCCEDKSAHHGSCAKTKWCSSNPRGCVNECQGSWDGSKCIYLSQCTTSRKACENCGGRWHSRKIFVLSFNILDILIHSTKQWNNNNILNDFSRILCSKYYAITMQSNSWQRIVSHFHWNSFHAFWEWC